MSALNIKGASCCLQSPSSFRNAHDLFRPQENYEFYCFIEKYVMNCKQCHLSDLEVLKGLVTFTSNFDKKRINHGYKKTSS